MAISLLLQLLFIVLLSPTFAKPNATHAQTKYCLENEKTLLLELKNQLVFDSSYSTILVQWNQKYDCCFWWGVECNGAGHVIRLRLGYEGISGGLNESSSLFRLNYLEELSLTNNLFSGSLPHNITNLKRLSSLDLSGCNFSGTIPSMLGNLTQLVDLKMADNFFSGSISSGHFEGLAKVEFIDLSSNSLSGSIPISIFNIPSLRAIYLHHNQLSGKVDEFAIVNISQLSVLDLSSNRLESPILNSFINLQSLNFLDLSDNLFNVTFQLDKFLSLPNLEGLSLSNNNLSLSSSHSFPANQSSLDFLDLSDNLITGEIPSWIWEIGNGSLYYLDLSCNMLVGLQKPYHIPTSLRHLDLHSNRLRGEFPNLEGLSLSNNNLSLSGSHSFPVNQSSGVEFLDLSDNMIAGEIPSWIWEIGNGSLNYLNLSCNMLVGLQKPYHTPNSLQYLDLHSNQLRGKLPSLSLLKDSTNVDFSNNQFDQFGILETENDSPLFRYSEFSLRNNSLSGSIPTYFCTAATFLVLDLSVNYLSGSIPHCLFENTYVLNLGRNNFSGWIPDKISLSCQLRSLDLSDNDLVGDIPHFVANCRDITVLNLSYNKLSGTVPTSLCKASGLYILDLSVNNLNGNIPRCLVESHLLALNLGRNNITGRVPNFTADCGLRYLDLNNNNIIGEVPQSLENCSQLEFMNVEGNQLGGTFPCMLPLSLRVLVLRTNRFHGGLRCDQSWSNLQIFDIANNNFSGNVDPLSFSDWRQMMRDTVTKLSYKNLAFAVLVSNSSMADADFSGKVSLIIKGAERILVKIWPDFTSIDLSCNNFQGGIPDSLGELNALYLLNLSHNSLTGTIPKSLSNLTGLGALDLSVNQLTGKIPKEIAGLTFLQVMNVSYNKLVGEIPIGPQIQTFPSDCFEGNIGLCGLPLSISCIKPLASPPNLESDGTTEIQWDYVFAAAGYVVGFGSFLWVLIFRRSFRERYFEKIEDVYEKIVSLRKKKKGKDGGRRVVRNQARRQ